MLRLALHRATSGARALTRSLNPPKLTAAARLYGTEPPKGTIVADQMIRYAFGLARSKRSGESYDEAILVLEQGMSNLRGDKDAPDDDPVGMLMLAMSTLLYERGEFEDALGMVRLVHQLENTSLPVRAAAWQGLVGLNLEMGLDASALVLVDDYFRSLKDTVESRRSASDVLTTGIKATKGLADLVIGDLKSVELYFKGCIDHNTEEGKGQLGNVLLCRGEFVHCTGNLGHAQELYEKALNTYERQDSSSMLYLPAANMAPEEIHLGLTCALGQVLSHLGKFEAEEVLTKALKIAEDHFGSTHPKVAVVLTCIALMFRRKAKLEGSSSLLIQEGLYRKAIDLLKAPVLDTEDDDVRVDRQDIVALARAIYSTTTSPLNAEIWAIQKAFMLIGKFDIHNVTIETDCLNAVTLLTEVRSDLPWQNCASVRACRRIMALHPHVLLKFTRRQKNSVAHHIAHWGRRHNISFEGLYSHSCFGSEIESVICLESTF